MKILVVDDIEMNVEILNELLNDKYEVLSALDGEFGLEIASEDSPDLILLDIMMPYMDGFEVCRRLKSNEKTKDIPIIFISAKSEEESIEKAYSIGGIDYLEKPFRPLELLAKIKREEKLLNLMSDLKTREKELRNLSSKDSMTNLYNRRHFSNIAVTILSNSIRHKHNLSILMIDIDNFKKINDTHGHSIGDEVIVSLAKHLVNLTRNGDIIFRWGGEEFLILLLETDLSGASNIAEKIRNYVENFVLNIEEKEIVYTISIGISLSEDLDKSIINADTALYEAKNSGKNKVCLYS